MIKRVPVREVAGTGRCPGFTLPEVMVAFFIGSLILAGIIALFSNQRRTLHATRLMHDMQQNLRGGLEALSREMAMTGYGFPVYNTEVKSWIPGLDRNPQVTEGGGTDDPDRITLVGAFSGVTGVLASPVVDGGRLIQLSAGAGALFDTVNRSLLFIDRCELARVTAVSGDTLAISIHPVLDRGLRHAHATGAPVERVDIVTYQVQPGSDAFPFKPYLRRQDHGVSITQEWEEMVAGDIENMQIELHEDEPLATVSLTVRSTDIDPFLVDDPTGDHRRRQTVSTRATMVNLQ